MVSIVSIIGPAPIMVPVTIVGIIMVIPVRMVPVVIMPVMRPPGLPVTWIISPIPG
jgi:hypothetical protein